MPEYSEIFVNSLDWSIFLSLYSYFFLYVSIQQPKKERLTHIHHVLGVFHHDLKNERNDLLVDLMLKRYKLRETD